MLYTNCDQFLNKRDDLCMAICDDKPDLIFLTEVIPKAQRLPISAALLQIQGYTLFRNFDSSTPNLGPSGRRGICIFVGDHLHATEVLLPQESLIEQLWLKVTTRGNSSIMAGCIYRSPSADIHNSIGQLESVFRSAIGMKQSHLLITGDFNLPQINWKTGSSSAPDTHPAHSFIEVIQSCFLFQHVEQPTRFREGETPNVLDLVFTNEEGMIHNLKHLPGLGASDHATLRFDLVSFSPAKPHQKDLKRYINHDDLDVMLKNIDWSGMQDMELDECYAFFKSNLMDSIIACSTVRRPKPMKNLYINREAWRLRKKKNKLWAAYTRSQSHLDYVRFSRCRNDLRKLTRNLREDFEKKSGPANEAKPQGFLALRTYPP